MDGIVEFKTIYYQEYKQEFHLCKVKTGTVDRKSSRSDFIQGPTRPGLAGGHQVTENKLLWGPRWVLFFYQHLLSKPQIMQAE